MTIKIKQTLFYLLIDDNFVDAERSVWIFLCDTDKKNTEILFKLAIKKTKPLSLTVRFMTWHSEITLIIRQKVIIS